jgi:hypothetical protein
MPSLTVALLTHSERAGVRPVRKQGLVSTRLNLQENCPPTFRMLAFDCLVKSEPVTSHHGR